MPASTLGAPLTERDKHVLNKIIRFGALTLEQLTRPPHGISFADLDRLVDDEYVEEGPLCIEGTRIFAATAKAKPEVESLLPVKQELVNSALPHNLTLPNLADWLLAPTQFPNANYFTERELKAGVFRGNGVVGGDSGHWPDGLLINGGHRMGIELELNWGGAAKYARACRWFASQQAYDAVRWYTASARVLRELPRIVEAHGLDLDIEILVEPIPPGVEVLRWARR